MDIGEFDPTRFLSAQGDFYDHALSQLKRGRKTGHWMWFIFPQIAGLGHSETSCYFALNSVEAAARYKAHDVLGARLVQSCMEVLEWKGRRSAEQIFGRTDAMKLRSSMTLFELACGQKAAPFTNVLEAFYDGERDSMTLAIARGTDANDKPGAGITRIDATV